MVIQRTNPFLLQERLSPYPLNAGFGNRFFMYYIVQNLDGIDQGYQSHQFLTESDM